MNDKVTLPIAEPVAISAPGKQVEVQNVNRFAVKQLTLTVNAERVFGLQAMLAPLDADDKPLPFAQPVRKSWTAGEAAALGLDAEAGALLGKIFAE
ncbi:MAG: hypothetical protein LBK76_09970 [Verrucomicrobiales bacterium]|jgi:hypothetical protein|nr:hypothetical protein [Verrucomicrobiales bacterium]